MSCIVSVKSINLFHTMMRKTSISFLISAFINKRMVCIEMFYSKHSDIGFSDQGKSKETNINIQMIQKGAIFI
jgi:hypothetical protein